MLHKVPSIIKEGKNKGGMYTQLSFEIMFYFYTPGLHLRIFTSLKV
jgi:hypothetical protein